MSAFIFCRERSQHPTYGQLTRDEEAKNSQRGKGSLVNKCSWADRTVTQQKKESGPLLTLLTKINSNWVKNCKPG